jgi:predicted GNAT family N-acyltransferase
MAYTFSEPEYLAPPGDVMADYIHTARHTAQPASIPRAFLSAMAVREAVFIDEQHCGLDNEVDPDDALSHHWTIFATNTATGARVPAATIRLVPGPFPDEPLHGPAPRVPDEPFCKLGRMATMAEFRGKGLARRLNQAAVAWAKAHPGLVAKVPAGEKGWGGLILIHAQKGAAEAMWSRLGFVKDEGMGEWDEEGLAHVGMWLKVDV